MRWVALVAASVVVVAGCGDSDGEVEAASSSEAQPSVCQAIMDAVVAGQTPVEAAETLDELSKAPDDLAGSFAAILRQADTGGHVTDADREVMRMFRTECADELEEAEAARAQALAGSGRVEVLVVDRAVPAGTDGYSAATSGAFRLDTVPADFVPADAVVDPAALIGLVTTADLTPGQVVTTAAFEQG